MKKAFVFLNVCCLLSLFSNQTKMIDAQINQKIARNKINKKAAIKIDDYEYVFDVENKFKGNGDKYEKQSPLDDSEAEIYNVYVDGTREKVNSSENLKDNKIEICSSGDSAENNDTFETATVVYKVNNSIGLLETHTTISGTINQKTSGWGPWKKTYIDKDFYCYDVCVTGYLELDLTNIPSGCDYDLRLYKLSNTLNTSYEELSFDNYYAISNKGGSVDEHLEVRVTPGTYYVVVYSFGDKTWDDNHYYTLSFEQREDTNRTDNYYDISAGRKNGDLFALWTSNYKPLGITPTTISDSNARVNFTNHKKYPFIHNLCEVYENKDILYAKLYVWDLGLRAAIYAVLNEILNTVVSYDKWKDESQKKFTAKLSADGLRLSIDGLTLSILTTVLTGAVAAALSVVGIAVAVMGVLVSLASFVSCFILTSPFDISKANLREYLINAKAGFEVGRGTSDQEVVMLRYRYHLGHDGTYYLDYSPVYRNSDSNLYNKYYIQGQDDESRFTGSITSSNKYDDLKEFLK